MNVHEVVQNYFPQFEVLDIENWPYKSNAVLLRPKAELLRDWAFLIQMECSDGHDRDVAWLDLHDSEAKQRFHFKLECKCCILGPYIPQYYSPEKRARFEAGKRAVIAACHKNEITKFVMDGGGWWSDDDGSVESMSPFDLLKIVDAIKEDHGLKALRNTFHGFHIQWKEPVCGDIVHVP